MRIVDAFWEERNMGCVTQEVTIEPDDSIEDIISAMDSLSANYQVVKVCSARFDANKVIMEKGFQFVESLFKISNDFSNVGCNGLIRRISKEISMKHMTFDEKKLMEEQIMSGMFNTDRISIDPFFSEEQSANRYLGWIQDEINLGAELYTYGYKDKPIGFCLLKEEGSHHFNSILGGIYDTGTKIPLGGAIIYRQVEMLKSVGAKSAYTHVSSNNLPIVRAHTQFGYVIEDIKYVYIKHTKVG